MRIFKETSEVIHQSLQRALNNPQTKNLLDFLENFREELSSSISEVPIENKQNFFLFVDGLRASHYYHLHRSEITSFAKNLSITLVYFAKWKGFAKAESLSRFKSTLSDIRKILDKSFENAPEHSVHEKKIEDLSSDVRDRIGARLIVDTNSTNELFALWNSFLAVFGGFNPLERSEFVNWYTNNSTITPSHKRAIREILSVPISVGKYKNYVDFPKVNGYQTLQATMTVQFYSAILPGLQFELQVRSNAMDEIAIRGSAAHQVYKQNKSVHRIITVDDPTVFLRLKKGLEDFIPLCHCNLSGGVVEVID